MYDLVDKQNFTKAYVRIVRLYHTFHISWKRKRGKKPGPRRPGCMFIVSVASSLPEDLSYKANLISVFAKGTWVGCK